MSAMDCSSYVAVLWDGCIQRARSLDQREWVALVGLDLERETVASVVAATVGVAEPVAEKVVKGEAWASGNTAALLPQRLLALP